MLTWMTRAIVLLTMALTVPGCRTESGSSDRSDNSQQQEPIGPVQPTPPSDWVFLVHTGYGGCSLRYRSHTEFYTYPLLQAQIEAARQSGKVPRFISSCFYRSANEMAFSHSADEGRLFDISRQDFIRMVVNDLSALKSPAVFVTGHSYGGHLAVELASKLPAQARLKVLSTLDPISAVYCQPANFATYVVDQFVNGVDFRKSNPGCDQAPADIPMDVRLGLKERSEYWLNVYQTAYAPLHSSVIPEADFNYLWSDIGSPGIFRNAHVLLASEKQVQAMVTERVVHALK